MPLVLHRVLQQDVEMERIALANLVAAHVRTTVGWLSGYKMAINRDSRLFRVVIVAILLLILGLMIGDRLSPKTIEHVEQPIVVQEV